MRQFGYALRSDNQSVAKTTFHLESGQPKRLIRCQCPAREHGKPNKMAGALHISRLHL